MGFRINTNVAAMNAHMNSINNNRALDKSLTALSTGLRINKAADDASGLAIANQLKTQASGLGQAIRNANDGINLAQTADGALEEYTNIINTVRTKAIQAASDGQNDASRAAIQKDIDKLLEEAQNIAKTTSFNGQKLLSGAFTDKKFQVGAYSNETVSLNIADTRINKVGLTTRTTMEVQEGSLSLKLKNNSNGNSIALKTLDIKANNSAENGLGALAEEINKYSDQTGIKAKAVVTTTTTNAIKAGTTGDDFSINGVNIGAVTVEANDNSNSLVKAINDKASQTGVSATLESGKLTLTSTDGRAIKVEGNVTDVMGNSAKDMSTLGHIELVQDGSSDFQVEAKGTGNVSADIETTGSTTTTQDSRLAIGSKIGAGSKLAAGSTVGGTANVMVSTGSDNSTEDIKAAAGSTIAFGSTLAKETTLGGTMTVGSTTAGGANTALDQDMLVTAGSTLKSGSVIGKGTTVTTAFSANNVDYKVGDVLTSNVTLDSDLTLGANMTLKDNGSDSQSEIAAESKLQAGSILGADFTVGLKITDDNDSLPSGATNTTATTKDYILDADTTVTYGDADDQMTIKAGSLLTSGTVLTLDSANDGGGNATWDGPDLVTTTGVIKQGDTIAADTRVTLQGDQVLDADLTTSADGTNTDVIKAGSILKSGFVFTDADTDSTTTANTADTLTGSTDMTLAEDMTVKAGSTIAAGSALKAGSTVGDATYVYGNGTNKEITTTQESSLKAGSTLEANSMLAKGSTVGGEITTANDETLERDMTLKAGSTLKAGNELKAGTVIQEDMILNTKNDGTGTEITVSAGTKLSDKLYVDGKEGTGTADVKLTKDLNLQKDNVLLAGTKIAANTDDPGRVKLGDNEITSLANIDVTTMEGALKAIDTLDAALEDIDSIRSNIGSTQNQLESTVRNISVTQVNVTAAESSIRDVDFAAESANLKKRNILAQSGVYAMSQANAAQQNVMRLLQ